MARRPNILRPTSLHLTLPEDLRVKLDLHLWSPAQGCIPRGAYNQFVGQLIRDFIVQKDNTPAPPVQEPPV